MRQIVLDTETTGLETTQDHRIIEIGCVELVDRKITGRRYHQYINPTRQIDEAAIAVHGITNEFLEDKPTFEVIFRDFIDFLNGSDLVIHNAPFDIGFLNHEIEKLGAGSDPIDQKCHVIDTLILAKEKHPGQRNNIDALCQRYSVDNSQREFHGALLDAEILADIYLLMSGGQVSLDIDETPLSNPKLDGRNKLSERTVNARPKLTVLTPSEDEVRLHQEKLELIKSESGQCLWLDEGG